MSAAKRFAKGLASIREPTRIGIDFEGVEGTVDTGGDGLGAETGGLGGGGGEAAAVGALAGVSSTKSLKASTSDSFSTIIHTS